ncbi:MAG TPA: SufE family protein [Paracoccaceae bacterium]|nr:SufE family protein [Paracoccaceae bacterium]
MAGERFDEIAENFELFDDWEERYRYVIELGREMPALPEERRTPATKVEGCASQVWLVPDVRPSPEGPRLYFQGDSDAMIVRGLISILITLISGRRLEDIRAMDIRGQLARLHLDQALSSQRSNGLRAMVGRIEDIARASQAA